MFVKDVMTMNVVSIPSNTSIADAKRIMEAHKIRRLPVVDRGRLAGIVTERRLEQYTPSKSTSLSVWEIGYLLGNTPVKDIMEKNVVTVTPDMTVEEALGVAQNQGVGAVPVVENGRLVGIVTTNDFFYKIANPVLGIGMPGTRVEVIGKGRDTVIEDVVSLANKQGIRIITIHVISIAEEPGEKKDIVIHLDTEDTTAFVEETKKKGYEVIVRMR
ncbi:MAG: histidine kinase [Deltaproteobacteria bacterium]|nr:CBS domain-containing protein [Deltaproteobacteria bacterium]MBW2312096.1 CBS domain-containing protein [Deltaproteobacteria bacterium]RLB27478.1 MAG: histidine kinase [Deltaproteobacteria bacterium]